MKSLRPLVLAFLILSLVTAGLPVSEALAHWAGRPHFHGKTKHRRTRHSRAWWRRHRTWLKRKRERAARRRDERAERLGVSIAHGTPLSSNANLANKSRRPAAPAHVVGARAPFDLSMPATWTSITAGAVPGTMRFKVNAPDGRTAGTAIIAPVTLSNAETAAVSNRTKTLGGIPFAVLRRTVIDRMVVEGGWVVNDMERELNGRRVYVVVAQSGSGGTARQSWTFYFTEMNGRVYNLSITAPVEFAEPLAADAERILASLRAGIAAGTVAVK